MSYGSLARRNPLDEISQHFHNYLRAVPHPEPAPTDSQMAGMMRRLDQRFEELSGTMAAMTRRESALVAELNSMRDQRDHWQRMAERLFSEQTGAGRNSFSQIFPPSPR
jgi:hypothetical protein